jgi:hypothetical protein
MTITTEQTAAILSFISNNESRDSLAEAIEAWNNSVVIREEIICL